MDGHGTEAGGAGNGSWIDEGIRGSLVAEWKQEAARAMLGKMSMCGRCVLCVCGVRNPSLQCVPEPELRASLIGVIGVDEVHAWGEGADGCSMCLGILQHAESAVEPVKDKVAAQYTAGSLCTFLTSLAVPSSCTIRQSLACAHVNKHLRRHLSAGQVAAAPATVRAGMVDFKEAFRNVVVKGISAAIDATPDQGSSDDAVGRIKITAEYTHEETAEEKEVLLEGAKGVKKRVRAKRHWGERKGQLVEIDNTGRVREELEKISSTDLMALYSGGGSPSAVRTSPVIKVVVERESVFLGGSYCKYSRHVSQSPWNEAHGDVKHSVQTLISAAVENGYVAEAVKFIGAGREDLDVRMLGEGRPFLLEFVNARSLPVSPHVLLGDQEEDGGRPRVFAEMEKKVNESTGLIQVRDIRAVGKEYVKELKNAAESKVKTYMALVWMAKPVSKAVLAELSTKGPFSIDQTTPVRVLHRRSLAVRKRMIHTISCKSINPHFMLITLRTEAGTYIKEFVHGDMGRTRPNIGQLLGCGAADILQLDVVAVEM